MQNFRPAVIRGQSTTEETTDEGEKKRKSRPCRAEIRWYGATDEGLSDYRGDVHLWGNVDEVLRLHEMNRLHPTLTKIELGENCPSRKMGRETAHRT